MHMIEIDFLAFMTSQVGQHKEMCALIKSLLWHDCAYYFDICQIQIKLSRQKSPVTKSNCIIGKLKYHSSALLFKNQITK